MSTPEDTAVIPADPVLDGELLDDDRPTGHKRSGRVVLWWQHSLRVPAVVKSRAHVRQAAKDAAVTVMCAPWWFLSRVRRNCQRNSPCLTPSTL